VFSIEFPLDFVLVKFDFIQMDICCKWYNYPFWFLLFFVFLLYYMFSCKMFHYFISFGIRVCGSYLFLTWIYFLGSKSPPCFFFGIHSGFLVQIPPNTPLFIVIWFSWRFDLPLSTTLTIIWFSWRFALPPCSSLLPWSSFSKFHPPTQCSLSCPY